MRDDIASMFLAEQMDFAADYVKRGRAHRNLTDAELNEAWKAAFRGRRLSVNRGATLGAMGAEPPGQ